MDFSEVLGQKHLKAHLLKSVENGRIPHAQLFVGATGSGLLPMAIAYASAILCSTHEKDSQAYHNCVQKTAKLTHPDLHFIYPVNTNDSVKKNAVSANFTEEWRNFVNQNPYASLFDWLQSLGIENKQGNISVNEAQDLLKTLALKSYEGGYKIMIIWMADKMNVECSNKILKIVEEPPKNTLLLLLTENEEHILTTITSRCQKLQFPLLSEEDIATQLQNKKGVAETTAKKISRQATGDFNKALHILENDSDDLIFEEWFVSWVRTAFRAKGNKKAINELLTWSENIAGKGRETQKKFLSYCMEVFRQALLKNYKADSLIFFEANDSKFSLEKFAPFIHQNNIFEITKALEEASYHIERNGNGKIILTDLSIQLTRLIHKKELV
ncbi:DNA polymerase III subunit [Ulvibacter litoralis]|uniref:DNA polymerase-3 subunit delta n=1 Tax=Ulvibacter litoralis TaxID=227084 RepID=A0A1G7D9H6_9FLAO|nr:DNA polymerase III subunit delta' [Ulvibacter litoralis]GHC44369.1 DNA polymerase III subunit delta' [Ulvibacter litoralis]SDE48274.1 DNA polymerase-3 subunit delta' [Ulvibacter litoralis]